MRITRALVSIPVGVLLIIITITVGACAPKPAPPPPAPMTALINITPTEHFRVGGHLWGGQFSPRIIAVSVGATVTWNNTDEVGLFHSVVSNDGLFSNNLTYGESFSYTFTQNGTFNYEDPTRDNMDGTVIVY